MKIDKNILLVAQLLGSSAMIAANSGEGVDRGSSGDGNTDRTPSYVVIGLTAAICTLFVCAVSCCSNSSTCPAINCKSGVNNRVGRVGVAMGEGEEVRMGVIDLNPGEEVEDLDNSSFCSSDTPPPPYSVTDPILPEVVGTRNLEQTIV